MNIRIYRKEMTNFNEFVKTFFGKEIDDPNKVEVIDIIAGRVSAGKLNEQKRDHYDTIAIKSQSDYVNGGKKTQADRMKNLNKRNVHDIWKEGSVWKVQAPKGIMTFRTKTEALNWVQVVSKEEI